MKRNARRTIVGLIVGLTALTTGGCGSTQAGNVRGGGDPIVEPAGSDLLRYVGPSLEVLLDHAFASANLGEPWLILNVGVRGTRGGAVELRREAVSIRTPDGSTVQLPSQGEFLEVFSDVQGLIRRARVASRPLIYTRGDRGECRMVFLPLPGEGYAQESVYTTARTMCAGMLYFPVPGGVQAGPWQLVIELEEDVVRVPFMLGQPPG